MVNTHMIHSSLCRKESQVRVVSFIRPVRIVGKWRVGCQLPKQFSYKDRSG